MPLPPPSFQYLLSSHPPFRHLNQNPQGHIRTTFPKNKSKNPITQKCLLGESSTEEPRPPQRACAPRRNSWGGETPSPTPGVRTHQISHLLGVRVEAMVISKKPIQIAYITHEGDLSVIWLVSHRGCCPQFSSQSRQWSTSDARTLFIAKRRVRAAFSHQSTESGRSPTFSH